MLRQYVLGLYFGAMLPVFGAVAVAYGTYELLRLSFLVSLVAGGLFGWGAFKLRPTGRWAWSSWGAVGRTILIGTLVLALIPVAGGATLLLVERFGNGVVPSLLTAVFATMVATIPAFAVLRASPAR